MERIKKADGSQFLVHVSQVCGSWKQEGVLLGDGRRRVRGGGHAKGSGLLKKDV